MVVDIRAAGNHFSVMIAEEVKKRLAKAGYRVKCERPKQAVRKAQSYGSALCISKPTSGLL